MLFNHLLIFFQFLSAIQQYLHSAKQLGSRSGLMLPGLIWVRNVCKGYKQMILVDLESVVAKWLAHLALVLEVRGLIPACGEKIFCAQTCFP